MDKAYSVHETAIVDDGVVRWLGVETAPGVRESSADAALAALDALGPRG